MYYYLLNWNPFILQLKKSSAIWLFLQMKRWFVCFFSSFIKWFLIYISTLFLSRKCRGVLWKIGTIYLTSGHTRTGGGGGRTFLLCLDKRCWNGLQIQKRGGASAALRHLLVWLGCVLDGAQRLPLVLQLVVELAEFGGRVAGLLVDSFAAFVALFLARVQTPTLCEWRTTPWSGHATGGYSWRSAPALISVNESPPLFPRCYTVTGCAARLAWWAGHRGQTLGRTGSTALASSRPPAARQEVVALIGERFQTVREILHIHVNTHIYIHI